MNFGTEIVTLEKKIENHRRQLGDKQIPLKSSYGDEQLWEREKHKKKDGDTRRLPIDINWLEGL